MAITAHYQNESEDSAANVLAVTPLFRAKAAVSFKVAHGQKVIRVEVVRPENWFLLFKEVHQEYNVQYDTDKRSVVSGGKAGHRLMLREKPHAAQFWDKYSGSKDSRSRMMTCGSSGNGGYNRRLRGVKESILCVDDMVAVLGTLRKVGGALRIEAGSGGVMSNNASVAGSVNFRASYGSAMKVPTVVVMGQTQAIGSDDQV